MIRMAIILWNLQGELVILSLFNLYCCAMAFSEMIELS
jgi:hypothetical protein